MSLAPPAFDYESAVLACARGERYALRALYEREARWLLGVAQRIVRDRQLAEDVLHDAFLQVWQHAGSYRPDLGSARGWIYTVVRHRALKEVRTADRIHAIDPLELTATADESQQHAAGDEDRGLDTLSLGRCLQRLDQVQRDCVVYAYIDGYTHEQIALRVKAPLGTVKSWIRRSLVSLKDCLS